MAPKAAGPKKSRLDNTPPPFVLALESVSLRGVLDMIYASMIVVERISGPLCVREAIYFSLVRSEMCSDHRASLPNPRPTIGPTDQHFLIRLYVIFGFIFRQP